MATYIKTCEYCGQQYVARRRDSRYCKGKDRLYAWRERGQERDLTEETDIDFEKLLDQWQADLREQLLPDTRERYARELRDFRTWCLQHKIDLAEVEPDDVARYLAILQARFSRSVVGRARTAIGRFYRWAIRSGARLEDPTR